MNGQRQKGMSSILAIFLVTVLAVLAAAGVQMLRKASNDATLDMQLQRAHSAARAGMEAAFWNVTISATCANFSISDLPETLASFNVAVTCSLSTYSDGAPANVQLYRLQAVACNRPAGGGVPCPNDAASAKDLYVEAIESGECVVQGASKLCRYR